MLSVAAVMPRSRASIMTGRLPVRVGLGDGVLSASAVGGLQHNETTLAEAMAALGYGESCELQLASCCSGCKGAHVGRRIMGRRSARRLVLSSGCLPACVCGSALSVVQRRLLPLPETAMFGKWHLGQREMYLPHNRGFGEYFGIPFSCDMGCSPCVLCSHCLHRANIRRIADEPSIGQAAAYATTTAAR